MAFATVSARLDETDKQAFDAFCSDVGINTSVAITMFVKAVLRERKIPFEITSSTDPFFSPENQEYVLKSVREIKAGNGKIHELIEDDDE